MNAHIAWIWIGMIKRPGVTSDGNFSSYLIRRSEYGIDYSDPDPKGQIISRGLFSILEFSQKTNKRIRFYDWNEFIR